MSLVPSAMRVALLLPKFSKYGGVEQFGYRLAERLAQEGFAIDFICARQETPPPFGVRVITVGRFGGTRFLKLLWFLVRSEQVRKQGNYALSIGLGKNLMQDMIRMGGGPLTVYWEKSEQALPYGFLRLWKQTIRTLAPVNWLIRYVERKQFTPTAHVVAVSHLVRTWLLEAYPQLLEENVSVVYNQPDLSRFFPPSAEQRAQLRLQLWRRYPAVTSGSNSTSNGGDNLIFIGTASTNFVLKGVEPLIRSLLLLPEEAHVFIAGGRSKRKYEKLAQQLGVGHRVHFCGKVDDMPSFYKGLDIFVLPTFYDACSNAVLEALASGCKTVSTQNNGSSYFLPDEAIIQNPASAQEIAEKLITQIGKETIAPFVFPATMPCGLDGFVAEVKRVLHKKEELR